MGVERELKSRERAWIFAIVLHRAKRASGFCAAKAGHAGAGRAFPQNTHPSWPIKGISKRRASETYVSGCKNFHCFNLSIVVISAPG